MAADTYTAALLLGRAQNNNGSEFQTGARAELDPTPVNMAMTSLKAQLMAQMMKRVIHHPAAPNFIRARLRVLHEIIVRYGNPQACIVDVAVGFAPMSLELAQDLPEATLIDIDRPFDLERRLARLAKGRIAIPKNLISIPANLDETPLHTVLSPYPAPDVVQVTGAYFTHDELAQVARYIHSLLTPGGMWLGYLPWEPAIDEVRSGMRFFKKQVGDFPCVMNSVHDIHRMFQNAGYSRVEVIAPSQIAAEIGLPTPVLDLEVLVAAYR